MKIENIRKDVQAKTRLGVFNAREKIYSIIEKNLQIYYGEYDPTSYIRTEQLLKSLVRTSTDKHFEVYFDASALNYKNGLMELKHTPETGIYGWATWGADKVLDTAMYGSHGGYVTGRGIWNASEAEFAAMGGIVQMVVKELKAAGLPVR